MPAPPRSEPHRGRAHRDGAARGLAGALDRRAARGLALLTHAEAEELFLGLHARDQAELLLGAPSARSRSLMRCCRPTTPPT